MKKAVSPVIATVILISITLIIASIIFAFSFSFIKNLSPPINCDEVSFQAGVFPSAGDNLEKIFETDNIGNKKISGFKIQIISKNKGSIDIIEAISENSQIEPGESARFTINLPTEDGQADLQEDIYYKIIPMIEIEGELKECQENYGITVKESQDLSQEENPDAK